MATSVNGTPPGGGVSNSTPRSYSHVASGENHLPKNPTQESRPQPMRSFQQILQDEQTNRNILEVKIRKITKEVEGGQVKPPNLTLEQVGDLIFDEIKVDPAECTGVALITHRYDTREIKFKPKVDVSKYLTSKPFLFRDHEVVVRQQITASTRVVFKNVPFNIPDEEILNLCNCYGNPVENKVHYERPSTISRGLPGSTRFVYMNLFPGKKMMNYYWVEGPLFSDKGARITILHSGQEAQCFNCLRLANKCPGGGNGKLCEQRNTPRAQLTDYMKFLKEIHGYMSLKSKYNEVEFPGLNKQGYGNIVDEEEERDEESEEEEPEADIWKRRYDEVSSALDRSKVEYSRLKSELVNSHLTKHNLINEEEHEISAEKENLKQMLLTANEQMDVINNEKNEMEKRYNSLHQELNTLKAKLSQQSDKESSPEIVNAPPKTEDDSPEIVNVEVFEETICTPEKAGESDPLNVDPPAEQKTPKETEEPTPKKFQETVETAIDSEKTKNSNAKETPIEAETTVEARGDEIMKIKINKKTYVHMKKSNFSYNKETDSLKIIDANEFTQELQIKCNAKTEREAKIKEMGDKALEKIKDVFKNQQRERSNSIRKRSEEENNEYKPSKAQRKNSSSLPYPIEHKGILQSIKNSLTGKEPTMNDFRGANHLPKPPFKSSIPAPTKS